MDMGFEVVVPVVEVDRAKDLDRTRQVVAAAIGAIGDLDRAPRVARSLTLQRTDQPCQLIRQCSSG